MVKILAGIPGCLREVLDTYPPLFPPHSLLRFANVQDEVATVPVVLCRSRNHT